MENNDDDAVLEFIIQESLRMKEEEDRIREEYLASARVLRTQQDLEYAQSLSEDRRKTEIKDFQEFMEEEDAKEETYDFDCVEEKEEKEELSLDLLRKARLKFFCKK